MFERCRILKKELELERSLTNAAGPMAVIFYANGCPHSRAIEPLVDRLAERYRATLEFRRIAIDQCAEAKEQHRVWTVPTFVIFLSGKEMHRLVNEKDQARYEAILDQVSAMVAMR